MIGKYLHLLPMNGKGFGPGIESNGLSDSTVCCLCGLTVSELHFRLIVLKSRFIVFDNNLCLLTVY